MKVFSITALTVLSASGFAAGHMQMTDPPPLRSKFNKFSTNVDFDMTSPMSSSGSNFPCKGHLSVLGSAQAQSVADWAPGSQQRFTIDGGANHNGGSCQASLSFDQGKSWKAIHSWIGNCPPPGKSNWDFTVPQDTPAGPALFAWSWFNNVGNREMYMNCAAINIKSGGKKKRGSSQSFQSRPEMFVANVGNGCSTTEGTDLLFPNAGPDVDMPSKQPKGPVGQCRGSTPDNSSPRPSSVTGNNKPTTSNNPSKPTPTTPSNVNNGQIPGQPGQTSGQTKPAPAPNNTKGTSSPTPTKVPTTLEGDSGSCTPGVFSCTSDSKAWQVCAVSQTWVVSLSFS